MLHLKQVLYFELCRMKNCNRPLIYDMIYDVTGCGPIGPYDQILGLVFIN